MITTARRFAGVILAALMLVGVAPAAYAEPEPPCDAACVAALTAERDYWRAQYDDEHALLDAYRSQVLTLTVDKMNLLLQLDETRAQATAFHDQTVRQAERIGKLRQLVRVLRDRVRHLERRLDG